MAKKRILLVDDSVLIRRSLADALSRNPSLEIVGSAPNGRVALMKIPLLYPDIVILDIEMPEADSLTTLTEIRKAYPQIAVLVLNVSTEQGTAATLEALTLGAKDYVTKPEIAVVSDNAVQTLSDELASKIDLFCTSDSDRQPYSSPRPVVRPVP